MKKKNPIIIVCIIFIIVLAIKIFFTFSNRPLSKRTIEKYKEYLVQKYAFNHDKIELVESNKAYTRYSFEGVVIPELTKTKLHKKALFRYNDYEITVFENNGNIEDTYKMYLIYDEIENYYKKVLKYDNIVIKIDNDYRLFSITDDDLKNHNIFNMLSTLVYQHNLLRDNPLFSTKNANYMDFTSLYILVEENVTKDEIFKFIDKLNQVKDNGKTFIFEDINFIRNTTKIEHEFISSPYFYPYITINTPYIEYLAQASVNTRNPTLYYYNGYYIDLGKI